MKHYNIHLKIKSPKGTLGFSVSYWAESLGEASRKAEADYPGALFDDGWVLKGNYKEMHTTKEYKLILTNDYGIEWGLKEVLNSLPSSKDLTLSEESIQRIARMVGEAAEENNKRK